MTQAEGAFALTIVTRDAVYGVRDPWGFRPLVLGKFDGGYLLASETCAFSAIGADCVIERSEIEHSVLMDNSSVTDIERLADSLIGSDATVRRSTQKPRSLRLMVGDHCQIDVE